MIIAIIIIIFGIILDQVTKHIAVVELRNTPQVTIIKDFFYLTYVENKGGAWGIFQGKLWLLIIVTVISLAAFTYLMKDFDLKQHTFYSIAMTMIIIGTIGNLIDRLFRGFVIDFLNFYIFGYDFPVFNVADICLTVGVFILIIDVLFGKSGHILK